MTTQSLTKLEPPSLNQLMQLQNKANLTHTCKNLPTLKSHHLVSRGKSLVTLRAKVSQPNS
jgi:hypothetical protein